MEKQFITADLYLTAAISILLNINPSFEVKNAKVLFSFPVSDDLYKAMNLYNNGVPINAIEYAQMIKRLRAEMIMRREMGNSHWDFK